MSDRDELAADVLAAREPQLCPCGAPCDFNHGLCPTCDAWASTLEEAA